MIIQYKNIKGTLKKTAFNDYKYESLLI